MTILEQIRDAIITHYDIPKDAYVSIFEEIDSGGGCCCHGYDGTKQVNIRFTYVPEGKKRKKTEYRYYSGTVYDLLNELDYSQ